MGVDITVAAKKWCDDMNMEFEGFGENQVLLVKDARGRTWHVPSYIIEDSIKKKDNKEQINHPSHYKKEGRKECIDEMVDNYGVEDTVIWCIITAKKYLYRAGEKEGNSALQDILKSKWYLKWAFTHGVPVRYISRFEELWEQTLNALVTFGNEI